MNRNQLVKIAIMATIVVTNCVTAAIFKPNPGVWQKVVNYAQTHTPQVLQDGLKVIAASLGTPAVKFINDKIDAAIRLTDIKKGSVEYAETRELLATYGLLGADQGIKALVASENAGRLTRIATTDMGQALARFWGIGQPELAARITAKGIGSAVREGVEKVKDITEKYF